METQNHKITYLNKEVEITQFLSESDEHFQARLELLKRLEKDNINWKDANKLSKIFYNSKYKKCRYTPIVYNMIKKYL
jgi:hypothetical protein